MENISQSSGGAVSKKGERTLQIIQKIESTCLTEKQVGDNTGFKYS